MAPSLTELFEREMLPITKQVTDGAMANAGDLSPAPYEVIYKGVEDGMRRIQRDLASGSSDQYGLAWEALGAQLAHSQMPLDVAMANITLTEQIILARLLPFCDDDIERTRQLYSRIHEICDVGRLKLFRSYTETREATIRAQSAALQELSAPIIPIHSGVLVLPLIGAIDTQRASTIMEALLESVAERNARVVLLDITGVPVVDTSVAHYLIQAARSVRLLGAEIVLVGIRPEIAQTIVQLGVDLSGIVTMADLQGGVAYAFQRLGLVVAQR
jgi:rsbT co-antagonist protein RsbR